MLSKNVKEIQKRHPPILLDVSYIAVIHTYLGYAAFSIALLIACLLHYKKVVRNDVAGYPQEWFPSVSATIGDWYPERNIFQILIALNSGPRVALVSLQYYLNRSSVSSLPTIVFVFGLVRTLSCGGWVYITSSDDHNVHNVLMLVYILSNIPWMIGGIVCTPKESKAASRKRSYVATAFFACIIPMVWFFVQHKVHRMPGAYTRYSFFEWGLIFFDILYDSVSEIDLKNADIQIALGSSLHVYSAQRASKIVGTIERETLPKDGAAIASTHTSPSNAGRQNWKVIRLGMLKEFRPLAAFVSDVYLSYIFWSVVTSLAPTLFYFSVWELGIAGHELALLSTLSPILLSFSPMLLWARSYSGRNLLHALSFSGLAAYALRTPVHRLFVVSFANVCVVLRQAVDWTGVDEGGVGYQAVLMGAGLILSSLSKHANHSNNPVWPMVNEQSGGYNKIGLVLALLALWEFTTRSPSPTSRPDTHDPGEKSPTVPSPVVTWLGPATALGSLIFSLHSLLSDSSTLIAWSWTGFKNGHANGPVPNLHGSLTLIAQSAGLFIPITLGSASSTGIRLLANPLWFLYGATSCFVAYKYQDWLGYAGGLNLSLFFMSIIPLVLQRTAQSGNVGKTYFTAWLVYCLLSLASVWTVAYAFVPGGTYLRERTDLVLVAQMMLISVVFWWPRLRTQPLSFTLPGLTGSYSRALLVFFTILSVLVTLYRLPSGPPRPFKPGPRIVNAGVWTLHFGIDNAGRDSQRGVRDVIKDMQLDIVGLLETDLHRPVFGNRDLTRIVTEELGFYVDPGPGPNSHTWGAALLSKFPIINSTHHLLPSPHGELAPAIEAVLDVYGTEVTVVVAHNGQEEDVLDRELQSTELARIMAASYPRPAIFLGYVVTKPLALRPAPYDILVTDGRMHDIDSLDLDRWCEYILYRGLYRTSYARLSRGTITDTELQIGQFVLPRYAHGVTNESVEARYLRSWKEALPEDHWFPMKYYGNEESGGVNGHYYHVFNTPLYYQIPESAVL